MPIPPLVIAGAGAAISAAGSFFGSRTTTTQIDPRVTQMIMDLIRQRRSTGFAAERELFDESIDARIAEIFELAGVQQEQLEGDFASRGVSRSPLATGAIVRDIKAPAIRAALLAVNQGKLGFAQLGLQADSLENQLLQILSGNRSVTGQGGLGQQAGEFGDFLFEFGLLKEFGLFDTG